MNPPIIGKTFYERIKCLIFFSRFGFCFFISAEEKTQEIRTQNANQLKRQFEKMLNWIFFENIFVVVLAIDGENDEMNWAPWARWIAFF